MSFLINGATTSKYYILRKLANVTKPGTNMTKMQRIKCRVRPAGQRAQNESILGKGRQRTGSYFVVIGVKSNQTLPNNKWINRLLFVKNSFEWKIFGEKTGDNKISWKWNAVRNGTKVWHKVRVEWWKMKLFFRSNLAVPNLKSFKPDRSKLIVPDLSLFQLVADLESFQIGRYKFGLIKVGCFKSEIDQNWSF